MNDEVTRARMRALVRDLNQLLVGYTIALITSLYGVAFLFGIEQHPRIGTVLLLIGACWVAWNAYRLLQWSGSAKEDHL